MTGIGARALGRIAARTLGLGLFASMAMAAPARAEVQLIAYEYSPPAVFGGVTIANLGAGGTTVEGNAGRFALTMDDMGSGLGAELLAYCIDLTVGVFTYVGYNDVPAAARIADATKRSQLAALLTFGNPLIDSAATTAEKSEIAAAIGLSVWEIVYDDQGSGYDVGSGNFSVYGDFGALASRSNLYLANASNGTWTGDASRLRSLVATTAGSSQDQIYLAGAVPEPATWGMMVLGFLVVGGALRRRGQAGPGRPLPAS